MFFIWYENFAINLMYGLTEDKSQVNMFELGLEL